MDGKSNHYNSWVNIWVRSLVGTLDNINNILIIDLGKYEKKFTYINSIQYNLDRNIINNINKILFVVNKDNICEYSGLPNVESYQTNPQTQTEGVGVGGESLEENFIDSAPLDSVKENSVDIDFMYKWIRKHSNK